MSKRADLFAASIRACEVRGKLVPARIVTAASDPKNYLHDRFDWNDKSCAHTQRLTVAADLIRKYRFTIVYDDIKLAAPVYIHDPGSVESSYVQTVKIAKSHTKARRALEDELARIRAALHRAMTLSAVFGLVSTFQRMLDTAEDAERVLFRTSGGDDDRRKRKAGGRRLAS
jgi:hypothetical protein